MKSSSIHRSSFVAGMVLSMFVPALASAQQTSSVPWNGRQAVIENVSIDRSSYKAGETLKADIVWVASSTLKIGQAASGKNINANITVLDASGAPCAAPVWRTLFSRDTAFSVQVPITADCPNPSGRVALLSAQNALLDYADIVPPPPAPAENAAPHTAPNGHFWMMIIIVALVGIGIVAYIVARREHNRT